MSEYHNSPNPNNLESQYLGLVATLCRDDTLLDSPRNVNDFSRLYAYRGDPKRPDVQIDAVYTGDILRSFGVIEATFVMPEEGTEITVHKGQGEIIDGNPYAAFVWDAIQKRLNTSCDLFLTALPYNPRVETVNPKKIQKIITDNRRRHRSPPIWSEASDYDVFFGRR